MQAIPASSLNQVDMSSAKPWLKSYDAKVPPSLTYDDKTFVERFRQIVDHDPDKSALLYMGRAITYRELDQLSNQLARYLINVGLKPGDVVGLHLPNLPAHYISVVGVQKAGCISTGLSPLLTPHEMAHQLKDCGAKLVITADLLFAKIAEVADQAYFSTVIVTEVADFLPGVKRFLGKLLKKIPTAPVTPLAGKTIIRFMDVISATSADHVAVKRSIDDVMFMMYTGGTTGPSKGAMLTQRGYMSNRTQVVTWLDITPEEMALSAFPLFHIAGLALGGFVLLTGATQICVPNPRDTEFLLKAMRTYRPTVVVNVPTVYFELMKRPEFKALDFSQLKWCLSAAAPFPPQYFKELESIVGESRFIELYGMTETSPVTCCNPRRGKKKPASIGLPLPDTEFRLIDHETGQSAKPGEPGEIAVRGPQLMKGYHNNPAETDNALREGWMFTGDVARMDEDGYFYLVDRVKDIVIVSGFKVFTRELDDVAVRHPDVALAASVGLPDPQRPGSERVAMAIVLKPGIAQSEEERQKILDFLKAEVAPYKVPKQIEFRSELPTSGVGKILKRELKKQMIA